MRARRHSDSRGSVAVEFALIVPILLLILLVVVEFAAAIAIKTTLAAATKDAVRDYAIHGSNTTTASDVLGRVTRRVQENALANGMVIPASNIFIEACDQSVKNKYICVNGGTNAFLLRDVATITSTYSSIWTNTPVCPNTVGYVVIQVNYSWNMLSGRDVASLSALAGKGGQGIGPVFNFSESSRMQCGG